MPKGTAGSAAVRTTEGSRPGLASQGQAGRPKRGPGRPKGSPNKPKSLVPAELAGSILLSMKDQVPPEHFNYLKGVIKGGQAVSTKNELDILIVLLNRNLWAALIEETRPPKKLPSVPPEDIDGAIDMVEDVEAGDEEDNKPRFRRDVTERLKVLNSLLNLRASIEKRDAEKPQDGADPLATIAINRGIDAERIAILVQRVSGPPSGAGDGAGRGANEARTLPVEVLERPLELPPGQ